MTKAAAERRVTRDPSPEAEHKARGPKLEALPQTFVALRRTVPRFDRYDVVAVRVEAAVEIGAQLVRATLREAGLSASEVALAYVLHPGRTHAEELVVFLEIMRRTGMRVSALLIAGGAPIVLHEAIDPERVRAVGEEILDRDYALVHGGSAWSSEATRAWLADRPRARSASTASIEALVLAERALDGTPDEVQVRGVLATSALPWGGLARFDACRRRWPIAAVAVCEDNEAPITAIAPTLCKLVLGSAAASLTSYVEQLGRYLAAIDDRAPETARDEERVAHREMIDPIAVPLDPLVADQGPSSFAREASRIVGPGPSRGTARLMRWVGENSGVLLAYDDVAIGVPSRSVIDVKSPCYGKLRLWRDPSGLGRPEQEQVLALRDAGIAAIRLSNFGAEPPVIVPSRKPQLRALAGVIPSPEAIREEIGQQQRRLARIEIELGIPSPRVTDDTSPSS
jgi:hypothetical protein